jgi:hypothetical protein
MFMGKASKKLKMLILHLWRINVKTTGGFINIQVEDFHMVKTILRTVHCTIIVCRPRQYHTYIPCVSYWIRKGFSLFRKKNRNELVMFPLIVYNTKRSRSEVLADETVDLPLDHLL